MSIFLRDIGENLKAGEDVALVRFDTYADFLVPNDVQADEMENVDNLAEFVRKPNIFFSCVRQQIDVVLVQSEIIVGFCQQFIEDLSNESFGLNHRGHINFKMVSMKFRLENVLKRVF